MHCPRCSDTTLDERDRDGVTIDSCPRCRGVWLDRGELEKLVARAISEIEAAEGRAAQPLAGAPVPPSDPRTDPRFDARHDPRALPPHAAPHDRRRWDDDDDDDDDDDRWKRRHPEHPPKRKSWFHSLSDLID